MQKQECALAGLPEEEDSAGISWQLEKRSTALDPALAYAERNWKAGLARRCGQDEPFAQETFGHLPVDGP